MIAYADIAGYAALVLLVPAAMLICAGAAVQAALRHRSLSGDSHASRFGIWLRDHRDEAGTVVRAAATVINLAAGALLVWLCLHHDAPAYIVPALAGYVALVLSGALVLSRLITHIFVPQGSDADEAELRGAIESFTDKVAEEEGVEDGQEQRAMLRSILDLVDVPVEDVMVHRKNVRMINGDLPTLQIAEEVLHSPFTRLPVWKESPDNIVGVVHTKLLLQELRACNGDASRLQLDKAVLEPWFIPESTTLFDQLQAFRRRRERFAIMVDEYGALMGVVTMEDILEEIVGKMHGEHELPAAAIRPQSDGSIVVDGKMTIRDLNREFDWAIPDEEYSTVAGLLIYETQRIPSVGQSFGFHGFRFDVLKKQRNQITQVRITADLQPARAAG